ncbi:MAG: M56 family metallopeptidase [Pseudomonadota bacterium]|nr:M56 family metallopeptidase [Pseudomonadota bacterium]
MEQAIWLMDLLGKSVLLVLVFVFADKLLSKRRVAASQHLLWLGCLCCLIMLPVTGVILQGIQVEETAGAPASALFELRVSTLQSESAGSWSFVTLLIVLYASVAVLLASRLPIAAVRLANIMRQSQLPAAARIEAQLSDLKGRLQISRPVALRINDSLDSPVSFGLLRPQILLPKTATSWSDSVLTDVLLHELCHIKRLDWLTALMSYLVACAFWINPLVWVAVRRLHESSENSCDAAVLRAGRMNTDYAESLLGVATGCIHARRSRRISSLLVQTMHDRNTLKQRISRVLEENVMNAQQSKRELRKSLAAIVILSVAALGVMGSQQVLQAQEQPNPESREVDQEMIPLNTVEPMYPQQAADEGIEGWVHVRFTVTADGAVDSDSVRVLDAEPAYTFDHTAVAATRQFRFRPRVVGGQPVEVPNVQYVFRYALEEPASDE